MIIFLMGCSTNCTKPTKPSLSVIKSSDGGICLGRDDTKDLLLYIVALEEGC
jgi:hypothetical protein